MDTSVKCNMINSKSRSGTADVQPPCLQANAFCYDARPFPAWIEVLFQVNTVALPAIQCITQQWSAAGGKLHSNLQTEWSVSIAVRHMRAPVYKGS